MPRKHKMLQGRACFFEFVCVPAQFISQSLTKASALPFFERTLWVACPQQRPWGREIHERPPHCRAQYLQESDDLEEARSERIRPGGENYLFCIKLSKLSNKEINRGWYSVQVLCTALFAAGLPTQTRPSPEHLIDTLEIIFSRVDTKRGPAGEHLRRGRESHRPPPKLRRAALARIPSGGPKVAAARQRGGPAS